MREAFISKLSTQVLFELEVRAFDATVIQIQQRVAGMFQQSTAELQLCP